MAMDNDTAALLLAGVRQVADDVPGLGPHARPSQMSKKGFLVDLRDNHVRAISDQQTMRCPIVVGHALDVDKSLEPQVGMLEQSPQRLRR